MSETVKEAHQHISNVFEKPDDAEYVFVMNKSGTYPCECWVDQMRTMFFLLRLCNSVESDIKNNGTDMSAALYWKGIALSDIQYIRTGGRVFDSVSQVSGGSGGYLGVSVGGIGFGELKYKPAVYKTETHDSRTVDLYFTNNGGEVERIPFTHGSLEALLKVIPEKFI